MMLVNTYNVIIKGERGGDISMYGYYHEHFEIANWETTVRVTCVCGKDFIWSVGPDDGAESHLCPHCNEKWVLRLVDGYITLTRDRTKAVARLALEKAPSSISLCARLFPHDRHLIGLK